MRIGEIGRRLFNFNSDDIADLENIKELYTINNLSDKLPVIDKVIESIKSANNPNLTICNIMYLHFP